MLIAAVPLLWLGLRGRVVDDHPYCRRCGFDLYGFDRGSWRCPECGKPIRRSRGRWYLRDVRIGRRERRLRPLSWGLALGLPAVGWLVMLAVATFGGDGMYARAPGWLLDWEARVGGGVAGRAVDELSRRACAGKLSPASENALVARFLDEQQDLSRPWVHEKGDFLGYLRRAGRLKPADWNRYVAQAVVPALTVRPLVRLGTPVPFSIQLDNLRFGTASGPAFAKPSGPGGQGVTLRVIARDANGTVYALGDDDQYWVRSHAPSQQLTSPTIDGAIEDRPPIARSEWRFGMWAEEKVSSTAPAPTTLPSWPAGVVPFAFAPPEQRTAVARAHPRMRDAVRRNLRLRLIPTFPVWASAPAGDGGVRRLDVPPAGSRAFTVEFDLHREDAARWPLPVSWSVAIRFGGAEHPVGITGFPREPEIGPRLLVSFPNDDGPVAGEHVDVILRPSPDFAERSLGMTEYWDGEIEFLDIPLHLHGSPQGPN
jgi:ribosomal protein L37E